MSKSRPRRARGVGVPSRKISETIIDFGAPLVGQLNGSESLDVVHATFNLVITVWNAHVMAMPVWGQPHLLEQLDAILRAPATPPQMIEACHALAARRRERFANDPRAVGEWDVRLDAHGRVRLHCDARLPPSFVNQRG